MKYILYTLLLLSCSHPLLRAQSPVTPARIHAHNDYVNSIPFYNAWRQGAGSVEADIFLKDGELYVAHTPGEIDMERTLDSLYLRPLAHVAMKEPGARRPLQLLIDIKTGAGATLDALIKKLETYPPQVFTENPAWQIVISGNRPEPSQWKSLPPYIFFDGRPYEQYTAAQLQRVALISDDFKNYTVWNGKGVIVKEEKKKISDVIAAVHRQGKKIRFWATPDQVNAWKTLLALGVDLIGTDEVNELATFIHRLPANEFTGTKEKYIPYTPEYVNNDKRSKVRNIILLIGDGMGVSQIYSGYTANRGGLNLFGMLNIGFSITWAADSYITDSAAGGTAMATGQKTNNRYVGVDAEGVHHPSIPEAVKPWGIRSALITAGDITDATPAAFYARQTERSNSEAIALDFVNNPVSILIGGGYNAFAKRTDRQDLFALLQKKGFTVSNHFEAIDTIKNDRFIVLDDQAVVPVHRGRGDFLARSLNISMQALNDRKQGFFIMAEGAQIDWGGHANQVGYIAEEMMDFDKAVGEAMRFADADSETLVIVTADHETGGLSLLDGDIDKGYVYGHFSSPDHSAVMVPVFAYGPHSQDFRGVYQNTALFEKIMEIFGMYKK